MLLEKIKFREGDIISLKLISGEEVIGKYISEDTVDIVIKNPITLAMTSKGPAMTPMMITVEIDQEFKIAKSAVILRGNTVKEIADQFIFQTTGIQPVGAGKVII